ncbi:MAG TPA: DUF885 family protein [Thermoanaerobaculia bacterium]|jgi:uncharacterized protein (DUF885 family)|nr:DUF885 family protein [Thermoanaerobaculia bacterium]
MHRKPIALALFALALLPIAGHAAGAANPSEKSQPANDLEARRKALADLLAEQWEYNLSENPEFASIIGDKRWNDKSSEVSDAAVQRDLAKSRQFLTRFEAIDTTGFPEQEALNKTLMVRDLREGLDNAKYEGWLMPVNQMSGIHLDSPQLVSLLPFTTVKDYDDFITRLHNFPAQMDGTIGFMRQGMAKHLMPPKFLLGKVAEQAKHIAAQKPEESPFAMPLAKMPASFSAADKERIRTALLAAIRDQVLPAYGRFATFVEKEYAPAGRTEVGLWSLPDGDARYAARVHRSTTTDMTPEEIHQLGLREVARIEGEQLQIAKQLGFADLKSFNASLDANPALKAKSADELVSLYRQHIEAMQAKLPQLFGRLPKAKVEVVPMEDYRAASAAGADYVQGTPDGSRPGKVNVNTHDATSRKTINVETTAYHEGVPGHHMQISIQQELPTLPPFRQQGGNTAFVEGWALYSERLGREVGFFQDPYSLYGHLQDEMLRAIRLVVDTGLHYKHWTREQVVQFFHDHSAIDEVEVQSETDRYIVWPGQALGYKIGQLKILELRDRAKQALGDHFDIRGFHDEVLGAGALPMDVLEARIDAWIAAQKAAAKSAA